MRKILALLLVLAFSACDDEGTGPGAQIPTMTGRWTGTASGVTADATLTETNRAVSGSGTMATPMGNIPISVTGTNNHPRVDLTITSPGQPEGSFSGSFVDSNSVAGTLTISGFPPLALTLRRQQ